MAHRILMTALSPTMDEGTLIEWRVQKGDAIHEGQTLCLVETDKTSAELISFRSGFLAETFLEKGETVPVGTCIALLSESLDENIEEILYELKNPKEPQQALTEKFTEQHNHQNPLEESWTSQETSSSSSDELKTATPLARSLAARYDIDLNQVEGTGPGGRITQEDVQLFKPQLASRPTSKISSKETSTLKDQFIHLSPKRRIIAQRLVDSKKAAPHFYLKVSVSMDKLLHVRSLVNQKQKARGEKTLGFNIFLIKILADVLSHHQAIQSSWTDQGILFHSSIDIALAVAQEDGLITPVLRQVDQKSLWKLNEELNDLVARAQKGQLSLVEYTGASFTVSNLGSYGIEEFTAIINPPGVAILAVGSISKNPIVNDYNQIVIQQLVKLTLSCDHRVLDGVVAARFLGELKSALENPPLWHFEIPPTRV